MLRRLLVIAALLAAGCESCRSEPPIIIRFEPVDAAGQKPADMAPAAAKKPDLGPPPKVTECKKDSDCILEPLVCCGCNAGGAQRAVHKADHVEHSDKCADQVCAQVISTDVTCSKKPTCHAGKCELK